MEGIVDFEPKVDFVQLSDTEIAEIGLDAAEVAFENDVRNGLTNGDAVIVVVGTVDDGVWNQQGRRSLGSEADAGQFEANVDAETGKLATALIYRMDSIAAYELDGDSIPDGPRRWTGAVYYIARVKTRAGWMLRIFAGAASGVQGHFDQATVYSALTRMGAAWALKMQAEYGKAA